MLDDSNVPVDPNNDDEVPDPPRPPNNPTTDPPDQGFFTTRVGWIILVSFLTLAGIGIYFFHS